MVTLAGTCFWYWSNFYSFLDSSGVPLRIRQRYPRESFNKYQTMRNILNDLDQAEEFDTINSLISNFYRLRGPVDQDALDVPKAVALLNEFRELVGNDPIELEIQRQSRDKARKVHKEGIQQHKDRQRRLEDLNIAFIELASPSEISEQKRGYALERRVPGMCGTWPVTIARVSSPAPYSPGANNCPPFSSAPNMCAIVAAGRLRITLRQMSSSSRVG